MDQFNLISIRKYHISSIFLLKISISFKFLMSAIYWNAFFLTRKNKNAKVIFFVSLFLPMNFNFPQAFSLTVLQLWSCSIINKITKAFFSQLPLDSRKHSLQRILGAEDIVIVPISIEADQLFHFIFISIKLKILS